MSREAVNKIIKSCIVSRKGGVPMCEIEYDYRDLVGQSIPYRSLGYETLQDFIRSIDFVNVKTNYLGDSVLFVSDPKVAHIDSLVRKQKNSSNCNASSKQRRRSRSGKSRRDRNRIVPENRSPGIPHRHYENKKPDNNYWPQRFGKNKRMEYTKSKWYPDRPKDSWRQKRMESRESQRFHNFNTARTSLQLPNNNSAVRNHDNSWSGRTGSSSSVEENMYNFNSLEEQRYARESRSWRFQVQVADSNNANSTVGRSHRHQSYNDRRDYNLCRPGQFGGGPTTNNPNNCCRDPWYRNPPHQNWAPPRDNHSGQWWPGLQGYANTQHPWMGKQYPSQFPYTYPGYYPWNFQNFSNFRYY